MLSTHLLHILPLLASLPTSFALSHAQDLALLHSGHPQISLWQTLHKHQKVQQDQALAASFNQDKSQVTFSTTKGDGERGGGGGSEDNPAEDPTKYKPHCFNQPLDHFDPENPVTFCQRYWVSLSHWNSSERSAPVIILDGGETSGQNRLAFLESGIINILSNSTGGIGIILEHRYYGDSLPNTTYPDGGKMSFSTDDLRFLNNEQAEMDNVRFLQGLDLSHLEIPAEEALNSRQSKGSDEKDDSKKGKVVGKALGFDAMRADQRPYIYYGGSYAGARAAHMIKGWGYDGDKLSTIPPPHPSIPWQTTKLPPAPTQGKISLPGGSIVIINSTTGSGSDSDKGKTKGLIWGSIASSAVTHAQVRYSEYHQAIQEWAPPKCMRTLEDVVEVLDTLLEFQGGVLAKRIQALFGLEDLEHRDDFMEVLASAHGGWQSRNWDPAVGSEGFYEFCDALTADGGEGEGEGKDGGFLMNVEGLLVAKLPILRIPRVVMNYAGWVKEHVVTRCPTDDDGKQDIEDVSEFEKHAPSSVECAYTDLRDLFIAVLWFIRRGAIQEYWPRSDLEALALPSGDPMGLLHASTAGRETNLIEVVSITP